MAVSRSLGLGYNAAEKGLQVSSYPGKAPARCWCFGTPPGPRDLARVPKDHRKISIVRILIWCVYIYIFFFSVHLYIHIHRCVAVNGIEYMAYFRYYMVCIYMYMYISIRILQNVISGIPLLFCLATRM